MKTINIKEIQEIKTYDRTFFDRVGSLTAIRQRDGGGKYYRANFERGMFLYYLVKKIKPKNILELGTGRGYGAICMSKALHDLKSLANINTIDLVPHDSTRPWLTKNGIQKMTLKQLMINAYPNCKSNIVFITAKTSILSTWADSIFLRYSLVYIDAGHTYDEVEEDWSNVKRLITKDAVVVFDDYSPHKHGVKKLVDEIEGFNKLNVIMDRQIFSEDRKDYVVDYGQVMVTKRNINELI